MTFEDEAHTSTQIAPIESPTDMNFSFSGIRPDPYVEDRPTRASEWVDDSNALLADAYNVRRLLRTCLKMWRLYLSFNDRIQDALFVAENEVEVKLALSVLVAWLVYCERQASERRKARLLESMHNDRVRLVMLHRIVRHMSIKTLSETRASRYRRDVSRTVIFGWKSVSVPFLKLRRIMESRVSYARLGTSWRAWKEARTKRYLDTIHMQSQLEAHKLRNAFGAFRRFLYEEQVLKASKALWIRKTKAQVTAGWHLWSVRERVVTRTILANKIATFIAFKVAVGTQAEKTAKNGKIEPSIMKALIYQIFKRWRSSSAEAKIKRIEKRRRQRLDILHAWAGLAKRTKNLTIASTTYMSVSRPLQSARRLRSAFTLWGERCRKRVEFRNQLVRYTERSVSQIFKRVMLAWVSVAADEACMLRKAHQIKLFVCHKFMHVWTAEARRATSARVLAEIGEVANRKRLGILLISRFRDIRACRRHLESLDRQGEWFSRKIWINRWRMAFMVFVKGKQNAAHLNVFQNFQTRRTHFRFWRIALRVSRMVALREALKTACVFQALYEHRDNRRRKRLDAALILESQKRVFFKRFQRFVFWGHRIDEVEQRRLRSEFFKRWVAFMMASHTINGLEKIILRHQKIFVFSNFFKNSVSKSEAEATAVSAIIHGRISAVINEWRLLTLFNHLVRVREERDLIQIPDTRTPSPVPTLSSVSRAEEQLKQKTFSAMASLFRRIEGMRDLVERRNAQVASEIVFSRTSPWIISVRESRIRRICERKSLKYIFGGWTMVLCSEMDREMELESRISIMDHKSKKCIMMNWLLFISNRRRFMDSVFCAWSAHVDKSHHLRNKVLALYPRVVANRKYFAFAQWQERVLNREILRNRVIDYSANYERRLAVRAMIGFLRAMQERRCRALIQASSRKHILSHFLVRWINAAVLSISLREVFERIEQVVQRMMTGQAMARLKTWSRFDKFVQQSQAKLQELESAKQRVFMSEVLDRWRAETTDAKEINRKINLMKKKRVIKNLILNCYHQSEIRRLEDIASEFAIQCETARITELVDASMIGWRIWVDSEMLLRQKSALVSGSLDRKRVVQAWNDWMYSMEISAYLEDLERTESLLRDRINTRVKGIFLTYLVVRFRESQGMKKFSLEHYAGKLKSKAFRSFVYYTALSQLGRDLQQTADHRKVETVFNHMFTEVYLRFKERMYWKRKACESVFTNLRRVVAGNRRRALSRVFRSWRRRAARQKGAKQNKIKSTIISAWRVLATEGKLAKAFLHENARPTQVMSYHDQRRKKVDITTPPPTPLVTPVPAASVVPSSSASPGSSTPTQFSYKSMRSKPNIIDEQRI